LGVLEDMEPHAVLLAGGRSRQTLENIGRRWWGARDELLVFGAGTPPEAAANAASDLAKDIATTWEMFVALNRALEEDRDIDERTRAAESAFEQASQTARRVRESVRAPESPP